MQVPISQRPWPRAKRFASVNNFGFGGTNAHLVLEKAPVLKTNEEEVESGSQSRKLFVLSANNKSALELLMKNLGIYLEQRPEIFQNDLMTNLAYTLGQRRSLMQWRYVLILSEFLVSLFGTSQLRQRPQSPSRFWTFWPLLGSAGTFIGRKLPQKIQAALGY